MHWRLNLNLSFQSWYLSSGIYDVSSSELSIWSNYTLSIMKSFNMYDMLNHILPNTHFTQMLIPALISWPLLTLSSSCELNLDYTTSMHSVPKFHLIWSIHSPDCPTISTWPEHVVCQLLKTDCIDVVKVVGTPVHRAIYLSYFGFFLDSVWENWINATKAVVTLMKCSEDNKTILLTGTEFWEANLHVCNMLVKYCLSCHRSKS